MLLQIFSGVIGSLFLLKIYFVHSAKNCVNHVSLIGKTVVVTGANTGIGFYSALEFAKRGARVILACRDKGKAETARAEIVRQTQNENVVVKLVDLSSFNSVRKCADDIKETEDKLDILVNNAGAGGLLEKRTSDGLQLLMQINYFGPALLTLLLLGVLKKTDKSRIINVSSAMAKIGKVDSRDLNHYAGRYGTYSNSKLCNILFTIKLAEKLKSTNTSVYSIHPGCVKTDIFRRVKSWGKVILTFIAFISFKTAEEGAQTIIFTATEPNIEKLSGKHFEECRPISPYSSTTDPKLTEEVWLETLRILHINEDVFEDCT